MQGHVYDLIDPYGKGPIGQGIGEVAGAWAGGLIGTGLAGGETVGTGGAGSIAAPLIVTSGIGLGTAAGGAIGSWIEDQLFNNSDNGDDYTKWTPPPSSGQCSSATPTGSGNGGGDRYACDMLFDNDMDQCARYAELDKKSGAVCRATAATRYGECIAGGVGNIRTPLFRPKFLK